MQTTFLKHMKLSGKAADIWVRAYSHHKHYSPVLMQSRLNTLLQGNIAVCDLKLEPGLFRLQA